MISSSSVLSTSAVISVNSDRSTASDTAPDVPPPDRPTPAVTLSMSPASLVNDITPVDELYEISPLALMADLALAFVKYRLDEPSPISSVSSVAEPPSDTEFEFMVTALLANLLFAIEPANMAFVTPLAFTLTVSESISNELSST